MHQMPSEGGEEEWDRRTNNGRGWNGVHCYFYCTKDDVYKLWASLIWCCIDLPWSRKRNGICSVDMI